jgi:isoleucyl-tRNA synthetase
VEAAKVDAQLLADMAVARQVVTLGHSTRSAKNIKIRQPLARAIVVADEAQRAGLIHLLDLVADELNVKALEFAAREEELVTFQIRPNLQTLSEKVKQLVPEPAGLAEDDKVQRKELREKRKAMTASIQNALAALDASRIAAEVRAGRSVKLKMDGATVEFAPTDVLVTPQPKSGFAVMSEGNLVVALDTMLTADLVAEGLAREFVRRVQDSRKSAGLEVSDHIRVYYTATPKLADAVQSFREYIMGETLADELVAGGAPSGAASVDDSFDGEKLTVALVKA